MSRKWVSLIFALMTVSLASGVVRGENQPFPVNEYSIPTADSQPMGIVAGPDGNLWFTEYNVGKIGRITPDGQITEFTPPTNLSAPEMIVLGPDGNLWFTENGGNQIGRITPEGKITEFGGLKTGSAPLGITAGADGNLWFTEYAGNQIGRITPEGKVTEFPIPSDNSRPFGIAAGPGDSLIFAESVAAQVGQITPSGQITEYANPALNFGNPPPGSPSLALPQCSNPIILGLGTVPGAGLFLAIICDKDGRMWLAPVPDVNESSGQEPPPLLAPPPQPPEPPETLPEQGTLVRLLTDIIIEKEQGTTVSADLLKNLAQIVQQLLQQGYRFSPLEESLIRAALPADQNPLSQPGSVSTPSTTPQATPAQSDVLQMALDALEPALSAGKPIPMDDVLVIQALGQQGYPFKLDEMQILAGFSSNRSGSETARELVRSEQSLEFQTVGQPWGMVFHPDGSIWVAENNNGADQIGRFTLDGRVTQISITPRSFPFGLAIGPDHNIWFTENTGNRIGKITLS